MGLFDRFKKKSQESESEAEEVTVAAEPEASAVPSEEAAERETEAEAAPSEEMAEQETEEQESTTETKAGDGVLNQEKAQGIFNESIAFYQSLPEESRQKELREALLDITNDPLSKTFLEAVSSEGMATPERVRNNISHAGEEACRLALIQLASEGEGKPQELLSVLGQTQTMLFQRILELNPSAGTSEAARPAAPQAPEGETPVAFFQKEIALKSIEKRLQEAQAKLTERNLSMKKLHDAITEGFADSELGEAEKSAAIEQALKENEEYQAALAGVAPDTEAFQAVRREYLAAADELAPEILNLPVIFVAYDQNVRPEAPWISNDGHAEIYTSRALSKQVEEGFKKQGITNMVVKEMKGEEIAALIEEAQHLGIQHFLLDNGRTPIDLRFDRVKKLEEESLLEYANRAIRFEFLRAKSYGLMYAALPEAEQQAEQGQNVRDRLLTMLFNAYRELGMGISYTLMKAEHKDDTTFYTENAMNMATALQQNVFKDRVLPATGDKRAEVYRDPLSLALVKRGNTNARTKEEIQKLPSLIPVFSDIQSARTLQANLALQHARYEILAITWDELKAHAMTQVGIVYDPEKLGLFIPKEDFEKVEQFRRVRGSIVIDHHKK